MEATDGTGAIPVDFSAMADKLDSIVASFDQRFKNRPAELKKVRNKVGVKRKAFLETVQAVSRENTGILPGYFNAEKYSALLKNVRDILHMEESLEKLAEYLHNAEIIQCNSALQTGRLLYGAVKNAAYQGVSEAKPLYLKMRKFFPGKKRQNAPGCAACET